MALDASIYQGLRPVEMPNFVDMAGKAANLSSLNMQNAQAGQAMADQQALRGAYARNMGADGTLNRAGVLSDLAKSSPMQAVSQKSQFAQTDAATAEAQKKTLEDNLNKYSTAYRMVSLVKDQTSYDQMKQQMAGMGLPTDHLPAQFDPAQIQTFRANSAMMTLDAKHGLDAIKGISEVGINETKAQGDRGKTAAETRHLDAETAKLQGETAKRNPDDPGVADDVAKQIALRVPREHQAKAFEEVKTAEDTKRLAPKIMAAFQMGSSRNPVIAAQGQREFEGLINTTVKDTEGTARQAAFDSIHKTMTPSGLTATPGENATRARTVQEYLASKSSAPFARGFGVDLGKFESTSPYQLPMTVAGPDGGLVQSAMADERLVGKPPQAPPPKHGAGAIVMVDGRHYTVGADGDTLMPVQAARRAP